MAAARELEGADDLDDLVSAPKMVLHQFISKHLFSGCGGLEAFQQRLLLAQVLRGFCLRSLHLNPP